MLIAESGGVGVVLLLFLGAAYFCPLIVAASREHHNTAAIAVINVFLGWTFIGWVVALAMAFSATDDDYDDDEYEDPPPRTRRRNRRRADPQYEMATKTRRWRCPGCSNNFLVPDDKPDPNLCTVCRREFSSKGTDPRYD